MPVRYAFGFAVLLVLAQVVCTLAMSGSPTRYLKLLNWDSGHYLSIAEKGYSYPSNLTTSASSATLAPPITSDDIHAGRANVVFFPGYPLAAHWVHELTGLSVDYSLLVVAQGAAVFAWFYLILLLGVSGISRQQITWAVVAVFAYPSAFFMVTGYTESLFLAGALGFIYWCDRWIVGKKQGAWFLALLHGWGLALTRIVGFAVAAYPVFYDVIASGRRASRVKRGKRGIKRGSIVLFILSVQTSVAFFVYCQLKFGDWAVYFRLEEIGWQNHRRYFAILNPLTYVPHFFFEDTVDSISRSSVTLAAAMFIVWALLESRSKRNPGRIARGFVAFSMFYIALTGKANSNLDSMLRYTLPVYILLVLNFAELRSTLFAGPYRRFKLGFALVLGLGVQAWCMYRFTHGHWVA
jgi:hypothetical protein